MMSEDPTMEHPSRSPRLTSWVALAVFSSICLAALETDFRLGLDTRKEKWIVAVTSISLALAFLAAAAHFLPFVEGFVGKQPEAAISSFILVLWIGGLPVIMNSDNGLAVGNEIVLNSNLYFFSWASFASILYIFGNYAQNVVGSINFSNTHANLVLWYTLVATSVVLMAASADQHKSEQCKLDILSSTSQCKRNKYAISLGVIGTVFSLVLGFAASRNLLPLMAETAFALFFLIMYTFGVGYITFGEGPARFIGNQYFSVWIGFVVAMLLAMHCITDAWHERQQAGQTSVNESAPEIKTQDNLATGERMDDVELSASPSGENVPSAGSF